MIGKGIFYEMLGTGSKMLCIESVGFQFNWAFCILTVNLVKR